MTDMHAGTGRIRELYQSVPLRLTVKIYCLKCIRLLPGSLPFRLDFPEVVFH